MTMSMTTAMTLAMPISLAPRTQRVTFPRSRAGLG